MSFTRGFMKAGLGAAALYFVVLRNLDTVVQVYNERCGWRKSSGLCHAAGAAAAPLLLLLRLTPVGGLAPVVMQVPGQDA